jgi:hypothetical protein
MTEADPWQRPPLPANEAWRACTVQHAIDHAQVWFVHCDGCGRARRVLPAQLAAEGRIALDTPILLINRRLKCGHCGARKASIVSVPTSTVRD